MSKFLYRKNESENEASTTNSGYIHTCGRALLCAETQFAIRSSCESFLIRVICSNCCIAQLKLYLAVLFYATIYPTTMAVSYIRFLSVLRTSRQLYDGRHISDVGGVAKATRCLHGYTHGTKRDYYVVLGVSHTATAQEIKTAYRLKALKLHPDHNQSANAKDEFAKLSEAYEVLSDSAKRSEYDKFYGSNPQRQSSPRSQSQSRSSGYQAGSDPFYGFGFGFDEFSKNDADELLRKAFRDFNFTENFRKKRAQYTDYEDYDDYADDLFGGKYADSFKDNRYYPHSTRKKRPSSFSGRRSQNQRKSERFCSNSFDREEDEEDSESERSYTKRSAFNAQRNTKRKSPKRDTNSSVFGERFEEAAEDVFDEDRDPRNNGEARAAGSSRQKKKTDSRVQITVTLSFDQAVMGCSKDVVVTVRDTCTSCNGTRNEAGSSKKPCKPCRGTGKTRTSTDSATTTQTCPVCLGKGHVVPKCVTCSGRGVSSTRHNVRVNFPAGVSDGDAVKTCLRDGKEISIICRVAKSDRFVRDGADIHSDAFVSLGQAALGGTIKVPGLRDDVVVTIPAGTESHAKFCLLGKGVPRLHSAGCGNHYVQVRIKPPTKLTDLQRALLLAFAELEDLPVDSTVDGLANAKADYPYGEKTSKADGEGKKTGYESENDLRANNLDRLSKFITKLKNGQIS